MKHKLAGLAGLAVALLASEAAFANGGYRERNVPAPIPVPAPMPIPEGFTYYLRADLGWGFSSDPSFSESGAVFGSGVALTSRSVGTDDVFIGTIGAGAYFTPRFRGDITLDFRGDQSVDSTATYVDAPNNGGVRDVIKLRGTVGLVNAYWDLLPRGSFTPYIGAGVGFVYNDIKRSYRATEDTAGGLPIVTDSFGSSQDQHVGLAAALMAGVTLSWDHRWALDINYRALYMDGGSTTTTLSNASVSAVEIGSQWEHQVRVGLRAKIW